MRNFACLFTLLIMFYCAQSHEALAQGVLGESLEERREQERRQRQREEADAASERSQTWNQKRQGKKARIRAELLAEQREERLNEIAYLYASLTEELPADTQLINRPYPSEFQVYGRVKQKFDLDSEIAGGIALKLRVKKPAKSFTQQGVASNTIGDINQGDILCLTFWARAAAGKQPVPSASIARLGVRDIADSSITLVERAAELTAIWQHFSFHFESSHTLLKEQAQIFFDIGSQKQRLEMGPVYLFNLGAASLSQASGKACSTK